MFHHPVALSGQALWPGLQRRPGLQRPVPHSGEDKSRRHADDWPQCLLGKSHREVEHPRLNPSLRKRVGLALPIAIPEEPIMKRAAAVSTFSLLAAFATLVETASARSRSLMAWDLACGLVASIGADSHVAIVKRRLSLPVQSAY